MPTIGKDQLLAAIEEQEETGEVVADVTAKGIVEAGISMFSGLGGAFAGTGAGVYNALKEGDIYEYAPAFEAVTAEVNEVVQYQPRTPGGEAAIFAIESLWKKYISDPTDKHLVDPNIENDNPLIAAIGKTGGEGLAMFLGFKAGKPVAFLGKQVGRGARSLMDRVANRVRGEKPSAQEALVDIKTGEPVATPDAPIADKGASMAAFKEFIKVARDPSVSPHEGVGRILKPLFYKPVQVLRDWGSPTLTRLADAIYAPTKADAAIGKIIPKDLIESTSSAMGEWATAFDKIIEPIKGRFNSVPKSVGEAITRGLRTGKAPKKYRAIVLEAREFLDVHLKEYIQRVLPDVGSVENYVPQVWDVPHILKYPNKFQRFLQERMGMPPEAVEATIRHIVESEGTPEFYETGGRLTDPLAAGQWSARIHQRGTASKKSFEKQRKIDIPEEILPYAEEFLVNNVGDLVHTYLRNSTKRVEYARRFGPKEERLNSAVATAIKELGIENNIKAISELTGDVYGLADALQGKYRPIQSLSLNKWNRRLANFETVLHLGLVALASFPETMAPAIQFGFVPKAYAKGFAHAIIEATAAAERIVTGKRSIKKLKAAGALEEMGAISVTPLQSIQAARFTNISSHFTSRFMHSTGLELLTDAQRVIAYETIGHVLKRNATALAKGKTGKQVDFYRGQLKELGVDPAKAIEWARDGMPSEGHLSNIMENAKQRGQRWAVTMPTAATKPLMFSDPHFTNILLFKSFTSVFSNLFMKRALKELQVAPYSRKAGVVGAMVAATTIAYYTQFLRELIVGYDSGMSPGERIAAGIDRAAITGPFTYAYVLANPYRFGFTDSSAKRLFNLLGPAVTDMAKFMDIVTNTKMSKKKRARELAKLIPIVAITGGSREAAAELIEELIP